LKTFVLESLDTEITAPPRPPKAKARGPWAGMTPEERSAYAKKLVAARDPSKQHKGGRPAGISSKHTVAQHQAMIASQQPIIDRIMKKMSDKGQLPDDPMAQEALKETLTVLRSQVPPRDKLAAARLLLDFLKAKPTTKVEHTVKTAEDILDEMTNEE
jgi:hypothetical protein